MFLESVFVAGNLAFPAPVQNQPFTLIGWKCAASQPLPWKLHLRPEVYIDVMLSTDEREIIRISIAHFNKKSR